MVQDQQGGETLLTTQSLAGCCDMTKDRGERPGPCQKYGDGQLILGNNLDVDGRLDTLKEMRRHGRGSNDL